MKDSNMEIVSNFIESIQLRYPDLSEERRRECFISLSQIVHFIFIEDFHFQFICKLQYDWIVFLNWILNTESPFMVLDFQVSVTATIDKSSVISFHENFEPSYEEEYADVRLFDEKTEIRKHKPRTFGEHRGNLLEETKILIPLGAYKFFRLLSDCPTSALLQCPTCEKIFLNKTKRKMIYCSAKCRSFSAVTKFRAKKRLINSEQNIG